MGRALRPFQAWQSLNSVACTCSSPYNVVGAAFSPRAKNPTQTYEEVASEELTALKEEVAEETPNAKKSTGSFESAEGSKEVLIPAALRVKQYALVPCSPLK